MLTAREIYRMNAARRVFEAKSEEMHVENRAEWARLHKQKSDLLIYVEKIITELDNG